jgi:hypothetical protein
MVEATHVAALHAVDTSAWEAVAAWDSATLCVDDAEGWATLSEGGGVALERVLRVEVETSTTLASTREDAKGFAQKITLLEDELVTERRAREVCKMEHREQF